MKLPYRRIDTETENLQIMFQLFHFPKSTARVSLFAFLNKFIIKIFKIYKMGQICCQAHDETMPSYNQNQLKIHN